MSSFEYPQAERAPIVDRLHGRDVPDPYRWLEDPEDPRSVAWSAAQEALFTEAREGWPATAAFAARLGALLGTGDVSAPFWRGERRFLTRRLPEQEHAVLLVVEADGTERVLVDPARIDPSGTTTLDSWQPSKEGDRLAYLISEAGTEEAVLYVIDVDTAERIEGPITRARYTSIAWLPGGETYYYVRKPRPGTVPEGEEQYHRRVLLHKVGTDPDAEDVEIFGAGQPKTNYYGVSVTRDGRWLALDMNPGTAARNDSMSPTCGQLPRAPRAGPGPGRAGQPDLGRRSARPTPRWPAARCCGPTGTPHAAGSAWPRRPISPMRTGASWSRRTPKRSWTPTCCWTARSWSGRCWSWPAPGTRSASWRCTTPAPARRSARSRCRAWAPFSG